MNKTKNIFREKYTIHTILLVFFFLFGCSSQKPVIQEENKGTMPIYGNWCGPGHPKHQYSAAPKPIDYIDESCMKHDLCYQQKGYLSCDCDVQLLEDLEKKGGNKSVNGKQFAALLGIRVYFLTSPICKGDPRKKGLVKAMTVPGTTQILPLEFGKEAVRQSVFNATCFAMIPGAWLGIKNKKFNERLDK